MKPVLSLRQTGAHPVLSSFGTQIGHSFERKGTWSLSTMLQPLSVRSMQGDDQRNLGAPLEQLAHYVKSPSDILSSWIWTDRVDSGMDQFSYRSRFPSSISYAP